MADPRNSGYRPTRKSGREDFTPLEPPVPAARAKRSLRPDSLSPNSDISMVDAGHPSRRNSDIPMLDAQVVGHKSKGKHGAMPSSAGTDTEMLSDDSRCDPHYASSGLPERLRKIAINRRNGLEQDLRRRIKKHAEVLQRLLREFDELQTPAELNVAEFRALLAALDELHLEDSDEEMTRSSSEEARGRDPSTKQKVR